ncbi:MAG: hypothetical protein J6Y36_05460 [Treponema sp.]|nr:hypothetical protein [Treponema sp.]
MLQLYNIYANLSKFNTKLVKKYYRVPSDKAIKQARADARSEGWQYIGECGKRTVDYMVKIVES